jgi:hypothetical protein
MKNMSGMKLELNSEMLNIPWNLNALSLLFKHTVHQVPKFFSLLFSFANRADKIDFCRKRKVF